jgi:hypothetical protein
MVIKFAEGGGRNFNAGLATNLSEEARTMADFAANGSTIHARDAA